MANSINNWASGSTGPTERDMNALEKAKKLERKMEKNGRRWHTLNNRTKVLIPCDKHGQPTKEGQAMIDAYNKTFT